MKKSITTGAILVFVFVFLAFVPEIVAAGPEMNGDKIIIAEPFGIADFDHEAFRGRILLTPEYGTPCSISKLDKISGQNESPQSTSNEGVLNHGMEVMSIIAKNSSNLLIPISGDLRDQEFYDRIKLAIKKYGVKFVNMSFSFQTLDLPNVELVSNRDMFTDARSGAFLLIDQESEVLFVISSGNGTHNGFISSGINIDFFPQYPVANTPDNILSVGAINTDEIKTADLGKYKMSFFSNFGFKSVDILAPGENVTVAKPGNTYEKKSGTSFSVPYILNLIERNFKQLGFSALEIKELLLKSAYIPNLDQASQYSLTDLTILRTEQLLTHPGLFPVRSGGIIFPDRAAKALEIIDSNPQLTISQAVLQARNFVLGPGEKNDPETRQKLIDFWKMRGL